MPCKAALDVLPTDAHVAGQPTGVLVVQMGDDVEEHGPGRDAAREELDPERSRFPASRLAQPGAPEIDAVLAAADDPEVGECVPVALALEREPDDVVVD